ncbi:unnamed protein product [Phaedon cochleariae]|uniref:Uncharacterized protein n=1 Tax=Phaedon cochleariae TaxID=80249 RepID=A0A9P0GYB1_PHACE|nr:unnamed protein product [Phaedon cochleariae]
MNTDNTKQFAVNWNNHMCHVKNAFDNLLINSELIDVTLYAEGTKIGAHKMLLSACSSYFRNLFREFPQEHPIIVLKGIKCEVLTDILKFIYSGEVSVDSEVFDSFIQTAEFLQISGLTDNGKDSQSKERQTRGQTFIDVEQTIELPPKAKRLGRRKRPLKKLQELKEDNDSDYVKCESEMLSTIHADGVSDQKKSQFPPDILLQTVKKETNEQQYYVSSESTVDANMKASDKLTCPICYKVFTHPYSLHHHKPVHMGRTKCPICSVVLSRKYNLKMHMKSRHNVV